MTTLFKKVDYSLAKLIQDIDMGEIGLPEIQRPFVWKKTQVKDLFDSMFKGYPVGNFLFYESAIPEPLRQIGLENKQKAPRLLIVDGQQRLTSLYAVMKGVPIRNNKYQTYKIAIAFRPRDGEFKVADAATEKDPEFISNISRLWADGTSKTQFTREFLTRLSETHPIDQAESDRLSDTIERLYGLVNYPFSALELSPSLDEEQVADVFVRINSKGKTLVQSDFILTLMSIFWDDGRNDLERFCQECTVPSAGASSPYNHYWEPSPDQLLRVIIGVGFRRAVLRYAYLLLKGKDLETENYSAERRDAQFAILKSVQKDVLNLQNWHDFFKILVRAGYRRSQMITSQMTIAYSYALYLIGKRDYHVDEFVLRDTIARWFFMAQLTGRYTSNPETTMEQDLTKLRGVNTAGEFASQLNRVIDETLTEDYWNITLPNELEKSSARSPGLFAYYAALNLLDAKVLFSRVKVSELLDPVTNPKKEPVETHHLFPKGDLQGLGVQDVIETNQIANMAMLEWMDNIKITDRAPSSYFPEYAARFDPQELQSMMYWHALPEGWENMNYFDFLAQRRKMIAQVIKDGFSRLYGFNP
jgi:hypothetical protein